MQNVQDFKYPVYLQPIITTMKNAKVDEIHINGHQAVILKQKKMKA